MRETSLFRNTWLNLLGQGIPLVLAFFTLPLLLKWIGPERVGVLTTLWVVIGYFGLLDLGLGRAVIHVVAERIAQGKRNEAPSYIWLALVIIGTLSLVGSLVVAAFATKLAALVLNVDPSLQHETNWAFIAVSFSLPLVTLTSCLRGVIEARQKFLPANILQGLSSGSNALVPLITGFFTPSLAYLGWGLFAARFLLLIGHFVTVLREFPELRQRPHFNRDELRRLAHFGSWSTVSNLIGPVMVYLDRLIVGSRVPAAIIPVYAIPHEAVTRLLILPSALARALFPKMSSISREVRVELSRRVVGISTVALFPIVVVMVYFADEALSIWLGPKIGLAAAPILKVLAVGYLMNAASYVPYIQIQSAERPDLSAKVHMIELPLYVAGLFFLIGRFGTMGAAWAWFSRIVFDTFAMFWFSSRAQKSSGFWKEILGVLFGAALLFPGIFVQGLGSRLLLSFLTVAVFSAVSWFMWFDSETRNWLLLKARLKR